MKKLLLLPVLIFFAACSSDDSSLNTAQENQFATGAQFRSGTLLAQPDCNLGINGNVYIDVTNGIQNPVAVFSADIEGMSSKMIYKGVVEIEMLSDCEDFNSGNGNITRFNASGYMQPPLAISPVIRVDGRSLPVDACYRWRFVVEGYSSLKVKASCVSTSDWYEAPLF